MEYRALGAVVCLSTMLACTSMEIQLRQPGEQMLDFPQPVAVESECARRPLPFLKLERSELLPTRLRPGGRLSHRLVYVMCPSRASGVIDGKLYTRIQYKGITVHSDTVEQELKPGRWMVDSIIALPEMATPGVYALEARFESPKGRFSFQADFLVEDGRTLLSLPRS